MKSIENYTTNENKRNTRIYRAKVAKAVLQLMGQEELIDGIGWDQLDRLPSWILLSDEKLNCLVNQLGVVSLAIPLRSSIDGQAFKNIAKSVDTNFLLASLRNANSSRNRYFDIEYVGTHENFASAIFQAGASVLIATVENTLLAGIISRRFTCKTLFVEKAIATSCFKAMDSIHASIAEDQSLEVKSA